MKAYLERGKPVFMLIVLLVVAIGSMVSVTPISAATIEVNSTSDNETPGDGYCTLREAINNANSTTGDVTAGDCAPGNIGADTISLSAGTYTLSAQLPSITSEVTIVGEAAKTTIIQADTCNPVTDPTCTHNHRVFAVHPDPGHLTLSKLTVRHGNPDDLVGGAIRNYVNGTVTIVNSIISSNYADNGGAIYNSGNVNVEESEIYRNKATNGGGIYNSVSGTVNLTESDLINNFANYGGGISNNGGSLIITNSTFNLNNATSVGGGIYNISTGNVAVSGGTFSANVANIGGGVFNANSGTLSFDTCTFDKNIAQESGGGVYNLSIYKSSFSGCTFSENQADDGGGIYNRGDFMIIMGSTFYKNIAEFSGGGIHNFEGELHLANSTLSDNLADNAFGGGIYSLQGDLDLRNNTLRGNEAQAGGGIFIHIGSTLNFANTIISNSLPDDCYNSSGTIGTDKHNLIVNNADDPYYCGTPFITAHPLLAKLADNGGPTWTHALGELSPAIDTGDPGVCASDPVNNKDQRGITRPQGAGCDIGAFEVADVLIFLPLILR